MNPEMHPAEVITIFVLIVFFAFVAISFFFGAFYLQLEHLYSMAFKRPFYVHFYPFPKRLAPHKQSLLRQHSVFYNRLSEKRKRFFDHRVYMFVEKYEFIGRNDFYITDEVKTLIAERYVMMTFGMRNYLVNVFEKIIIYPEPFYSQITEAYHKGEFNPRLRVVVFSWADFLQGNDVSSDNLNLGIHEFSHVLHHHGRKRGDVSANIFTSQYDRIIEEVNHHKNRELLLNSGYFREYAYTNQFEFLAVILEHYFETPEEFRAKFPQLYRNVSRMLNHRH